jgi:hypothetical protein
MVAAVHGGSGAWWQRCMVALAGARVVLTLCLRQ